jgi:hypothetical protein
MIPTTIPIAAAALPLAFPHIPERILKESS